MERVETLLQKLQEQIGKHAEIAAMLLTVQQLQAELLHLQQGQPAAVAGNVAVVMPVQHSTLMEQEIEQVPLPEAVAPVPEIQQPEAESAPEKTIEVLQVDEAEIEAELEEIKRNAAIKNNMSVHNRPVILFEEMADVPTLTHQQNGKVTGEKEINDVAEGAVQPSLNDKLKQSAIELGDQLTEAPVKDLRKAIGINDQYLFINELFRGDETMYERSIKTINGFSILPEAEYWIQRELKVKLGWSESNETVQQFNQLIKRRFS
jgi:hypothetical protein